MALGKIAHIDFTIGDLEKAEAYFTKKLGFKFLRRIEHQDKSISSEFTSPAGDFILQLHQGSAEELKERRERSPEWSLFLNHIAFKVDDINKSFEELKSKGVLFNSPTPMFNPASGRTLANIYDEDGRLWIQLSDH